MPTELVSYEGERNERGEPHGRGISIDTDGERWEGEFRNGYPDGNGVYTNPEGRYEGEVRQGVLDGQGKLTLYMEGNSRLEGLSRCGYEGEWRDGKYHGWGILDAAIGDRYEGEFRNGLAGPSGAIDYGVNFSEPQGDWKRYEGEVGSDGAHGRGILWFRDGGYYEGEFANGKMHGHGVSITSSGDRYEGYFRYDEAINRSNMVQGSRKLAQQHETPTQSKGPGLAGSIGAFVGGFLRAIIGSGASSSGTTWQCIKGHTMTSTFNPGSCSWCGNTMWPK